MHEQSKRTATKVERRKTTTKGEENNDNEDEDEEEGEEEEEALFQRFVEGEVEGSLRSSKSDHTLDEITFAKQPAVIRAVFIPSSGVLAV